MAIAGKNEGPVKADSSRSIHILVVEDTGSDAALVSRLLRNLDPKELLSVDVHIATDGETAIDYLFHRGVYSNSPTPDAVILDINLPKKSGFDVLSEMRKQPQYSKTPVIMLSTSRAHEDILKSYSMDAVSFITKPSKLADLEDAIKRFLAFEFSRVLREKIDHNSTDLNG